MLSILSFAVRSKGIIHRNYYDSNDPQNLAWNGQQQKDNKYRYNGKEFVSNNGLNWLDYGFRFYDPAIARFTTVDALADHPNQVDKSVYAYAWNNPISLTDPDGNCPHCPVGFAIGFLADVGSQILFEGKGLEDVNYASAAISGVVGMASGGLTSVTKSMAKGAMKKGVKMAANTALEVGESVGKQVVSGDGVSLGQTVSDVGMSKIGNQVKVFGDSNIKVKENAVNRAERVAAKNPRAGKQQKVAKSKQSLNSSNNTNAAASATASNGLQEISNNTILNINFPNGSGGVMPNNQQMARDNTRIHTIIINN